MTSSKVEERNMKHIFLNNLGNKYNLVMKFDQFMLHYKRKLFIKKFNENMAWKLLPGLS